MSSRTVSIVIFQDHENVILQERSNHSKVGEEYGFFGGGIEEGETSLQGLKRELMEEIQYVPKILNFWNTVEFDVKEEGKYKGWHITCHNYLSPITPDIENAKPLEGGKVIKIKIKDALNLPGLHYIDKNLIKELNDQDWITPKAEIRESEIGGRGLFALEPVKKDELVVVWRGTYTNKKGAEEAEKQGKLVMQWDTDLFSVEDRGEGDGYYINHSCEPNLWLKDAYSLVAMRDINQGEELTADYAIWEQDEDYISKWSCNCGSRTCRGKLTGKDWQLQEIQKKYKGHFSPFIQKKINEIR